MPTTTPTLRWVSMWPTAPMTRRAPQRASLLPAHRPDSVTSTVPSRSPSAATATSPNRWQRHRCRPGRASPPWSARRRRAAQPVRWSACIRTAGVEQMVITAAFGSTLPQFKMLAHGIVTLGHPRRALRLQPQQLHLPRRRCVLVRRAMEQRGQLHSRRGLPAEPGWFEHDSGDVCTNDCRRRHLRRGLAAGQQLSTHARLQRFLCRPGCRSADASIRGELGSIPVAEPRLRARLPGVHSELHRLPMAMHGGRQRQHRVDVAGRHLQRDPEQHRDRAKRWVCRSTSRSTSAASTQACSFSRSSRSTTPTSLRR